MQKIVDLDESNARYRCIGGGSFWNGSFEVNQCFLEKDHAGVFYLPLQGDKLSMSTLYPVVMDGGDYDGLLHRFGFGGSNCSMFCSVCRADDKHQLANDGETVYRTHWTLEQSRQLHRDASANPDLLGKGRSKRTILQYSNDVAQLARKVIF